MMNYIYTSIVLLSILIAQSDIDVSPDSIYQHLYVNGDSTQLLTIYNNGNSNLEVELSTNIINLSDSIIIRYWVQTGPDTPEDADPLKVYYYSKNSVNVDCSLFLTLSELETSSPCLRNTRTYSCTLV